jgi:hypothetical protein
MTTVGYGDYTPHTTLGRALVIISCFCGVFLLSMLIVAITNVLHLVGNEHNIYLLLERIELMKDKDVLAAKMVAKYMKLIKKFKNKTIKPDDHEYEKEMLTYTRLNFKKKCKELESTFPVYSQYDLIRDQLTHLEGAIEKIHKNYEVVYNRVEKLFDRIS